MLIIGTRGFLGPHLARAAEGQFEMVDENGIDITNLESVQACFETGRPDIVVLFAAMSDIDRCEKLPELAEQVNVDGPVNVARECARRGARLIFTSSGAVFDGKQQGYVESDPPSPVSVYGRTKAEAEIALTSILPSTIVVRLPLVLGYASNSRTNSLLNKLRDAFTAGRPVRAAENEFRNAIDVASLNEFLLKLAAMPDCAGVFHAGSDLALSRYEMARSLAEKMGFSPTLVQPESTPPPGRAPRGSHHYLIAQKISAACAIPIPTSETVLERCLHAIT